MTQLTQEHFDQAVKTLASRAELDELKDDIKTVKQNLNQHTNILDGIVKNTCDHCHKHQHKDPYVEVRDYSAPRNFLLGHAFCAACGKTVLNFLGKQQLLAK